MLEKFIILGVPPGGLFLSRQLRKAYPSSVIFAVGDGKRDIGRFSNTLDRFFSIDCEKNVLEVIKYAYSEIGGGKVMAFFGSNPMLEVVIERFPEVFDFLKFENPFDVYQKIVNKNEALALCTQLAIPTPKEFKLTDGFPNPTIFPFVIKPLIKHGTIWLPKCSYIRTKNDYELYISKIKQLKVAKEQVICQQLIEGDNRWEYGYGGLFHDGKAVIDICFHQFIQVPQGLCCYCREMTNNVLENEVKSLVQPFLSYTHYNGFIEFDIKQDSNSKQLFLLDINPRPWRSSDMLAAKLKESTVFNPIQIEKKVIWRYPYREIFAKKYANNVSYKVCKSLAKSQSTVTHYTLSDKHDWKPLFNQLILDFNDFFHKLLKRVKK